jgi:hypothetical protein
MFFRDFIRIRFELFICFVFIKSVEDKHIAATRVNQALESQILQLYVELEEVKAKLKGDMIRQLFR